MEKNKSTIKYQLIQSNRKTIVISISADGNITVKAPRHLGAEEIAELVQLKSRWIEKKLTEQKRMNQNWTPKKYIDGETFLYLGKSHTLLRIIDHKYKKPVVKLEGDFLIVMAGDSDQSQLKQSVELWYRTQAKKVIPERVKEYSQYIEETFETIRIKDQKKRWGSCSSKGNLNFNWRLIMAPVQILDYVVVHELCHLKHMDHSKAFWNHVADILPNHQECRKWLKDYGIRLYC